MFLFSIYWFHVFMRRINMSRINTLCCCLTFLSEWCHNTYRPLWLVSINLKKEKHVTWSMKEECRRICPKTTLITFIWMCGCYKRGDVFYLWCDTISWKNLGFYFCPHSTKFLHRALHCGLTILQILEFYIPG